MLRQGPHTCSAKSIGGEERSPLAWKLLLNRSDGPSAAPCWLLVSKLWLASSSLVQAGGCCHACAVALCSSMAYADWGCIARGATGNPATLCRHAGAAAPAMMVDSATACICRRHTAVQQLGSRSLSHASKLASPSMHPAFPCTRRTDKHCGGLHPIHTLKQPAKTLKSASDKQCGGGVSDCHP